MQVGTFFDCAYHLYTLLKLACAHTENLNAPSLADYDHFKKTIDLSATAEDHNEVDAVLIKTYDNGLGLQNTFLTFYIHIIVHRVEMHPISL